MPTEPELRSVMYERKFGKERAGTISQMMAERFRNMGLEPPPPGAQTSSSHTGMRLLEYALQNHPEKQIEVGEALFDAYHSKGVHPSDIDRMATIAVDKGIFSSKDEATAWLKGDEYEQEVQKGYVDARKMGITGVPFFVFQGKWASSGAIGEEEFETVCDGSRGGTARLMPAVAGRDLEAGICRHRIRHRLILIGVPVLDMASHACISGITPARVLQRYSSSLARLATLHHKQACRKP